MFWALKHSKALDPHGQKLVYLGIRYAIKVFYYTAKRGVDV